MSWSDAPIPNTPEAKFAFQQKGFEQRLSRLESPSVTPPDVPIPFRMRSTFVLLVNETAFTTCFQQIFPRAYYDAIYLEVLVITEDNRAGEIRLEENNSGAVTSTLSVPANTNATAQFMWLHGQPTDPSAALQQFDLLIEARKLTSGGSATPVPGFEIFQPRLAVFTPSELLDGADSTGVPVLI